MAGYSVPVKNLLSQSSDGKQIKVVHTVNGSADTIHTAGSGIGSVDEVWLYAYNDDVSTRTLTLLWGGTVEPDNKIAIAIPAQSGRTLVVDGMLLRNGLIVKAYASAANVIMIDGFVNTIT